MNCPVSASRTPLFATGDAASCTGTGDELAAPPEPEKGTPFSVSRIAPAAFRTVKVVKVLDRLAPPPAVESKMVALTVSSHEYRTLSSVIELCGNDCGPRVGAASARYTGPATRRAYV